MWEWCLKEYESENPVARFLFNNFYSRIERVVSLLDKDDRILEVGCGAGVSSRRINAMLGGQRFEVSDVDSRYVSKLRTTDFPLPVRQESVLALDRPDKEFDCIFMLEVMEHVPDYEKALSELFRVSRKHVVISVPNEPLWRMLNVLRARYVKDFGNTPGHLNHWSPRSFRKLVSHYGDIVRMYTPLPWIIVLARVKPHA